MLRVLTTASSRVEQSLLLARLSDAGIPCVRGAGGPRAVLGSRRDILVEEEDLARAEKILEEDDEGYDEEELARLSEEAGRQAAQVISPLPQSAPEDRANPLTPAETQAPADTHGLLKVFERFTRDNDQANSPFGR